MPISQVKKIPNSCFSKIFTILTIVTILVDQVGINEYIKLKNYRKYNNMENHI